MTYESEQPMIPIRPTAVAAEDNMGVMVWVLGEHRATPTNYLSLEINQALINWFNPNSNYNDVINLAADEAGGHGFVTERAGDSADYAETILADSEEWDSAIGDQNWTGKESELVFQTAQFYGSWDGFQEAIEAHVVLPEDTNMQDYLQCIQCYNGQIVIDDVAAFIAEIKQNVIEPMRLMQELLLSRPYVTRLYTTLSASEMTLDPCFDFNPDLPDYDNLHTATRIVHCAPWYSTFDAPWSVELPQGGTVRGMGNGNWPFSLDGEMPANLRVLQIGTSGLGDLVTDNSSTISRLMSESNDAVAAGSSGGGCNCNIQSRGQNTGTSFWLLVGLGMLLLQRRRRRL